MSRFIPKMYQFLLASNVIAPFLVSAVFFVVFLMTFEMFRILQLMSSEEVSFGFVMGLMGDVAITLVPMAIPLSIFFSVIFSLGRMSGDSEYVALRAAGLEKSNLLKPFLAVGFLVAVNVYYLNQELVPEAHTRVRKKIKILSSASLIQGIKGGKFFTSIPNVTIFPASMDSETLELSDIFLHIYEPGQVLDKVIWANNGKILHSKNPATGIETFKLFLSDGNITSFQSGEEDVEKILFE
ncbi:MAG: LptF/LptG family permease, partial [Bacteriovoracaceae bacterium]